MTWSGNLYSPTKASSTSASTTPLVVKKLAIGCQKAPKKSIRRWMRTSGRAGSRQTRVAMIGSTISEAMAR
ncbi:hypothetical protein D3C81_2153770 [compost metagenome]